MSAQLIPFVKPRWADSNGVPLAGGLLYTYAAGTVTPLATYTDQSGGTPNTNPVVLDAYGAADVWLGSNAYKLVLKDVNSVTQWTEDNVAIVNLTPSQVTSLIALIGNAPVTAVMTALYTRVVGSSAQVTSGLATDLTIASALSAAVSGNSILILAGTYTESPTISTSVTIEGTGENCNIVGAITFASGSDYSYMRGIRTTTSITLNTGVKGVIITEVFLASGQTFIDNSTGSLVSGIQET